MTAGNHYRRAYISPEVLADFIEVPAGATIKAVNWQEDRQAFILILEMPAEEAYFVDSNSLIPELELKPVVGTDDDGGRHIRFSWPEEVRSQEDDPKRRQRSPRRKKPEEALASA